MITEPCYTTREEVMTALDMHETLRDKQLVDSAVQAATGDVYGLLHRRFYPYDATLVFDWPNWDYAAPWRLDFRQYDLIVATAMTTGTDTIDLDDVFFEPADKRPNEPYTYLELDRASNAAFGAGPTPQHDVAIVGTWGYSAQTSPAGQLAAAVTDTTSTTLQITDSSLVGTGQILLAGSERLIVSDRAMVSTGQTLTGPLALSANSNLAGVSDGTQFGAGEVLLIDAERMLITDIAGNNLVVKRGWDGTALAAHDTSATVYAPRLLTVMRGELGTTAATHTDGSALVKYVPAPLIGELALALAENSVLQKTSGYARTVGAGDTSRNASGAGLADIQARAYARYGRKMRTAAI